MRIVILLGTIFLSACNTQEFKNKEEIATIPAETIRPYLLKKALIDYNEKSFGVRIYELIYKVTADNREEFNASAIVAVPTAIESNDNSYSALENIKSRGFATVIDNHPTKIDKNSAPSFASKINNFPNSLFLFTAKSGFITLMPDFTGYGTSASLTHPYLIKKQNIANSKALLKAYRAFCQEKKIPINIDVGLYMVGYSEGAYISLAALDTFNKNSTKITLTIAGGTPALPETIAKEKLESNSNEGLLFNAYLLYSYSKYYHDIDLKKIINRSYYPTFCALFNGNQSVADIKKALPRKLYGEDALLQPEFIENFESSTFYKHLQENSLRDLNIKDSVKLFHCKNDNLIPYSIAQKELDILQSKGTQATLHNVEKYVNYKKSNHVECGIYSYIVAEKIFRRLRLALQGY